MKNINVKDLDTIPETIHYDILKYNDFEQIMEIKKKYNIDNYLNYIHFSEVIKIYPLLYVKKCYYNNNLIKSKHLKYCIYVLINLKLHKCIYSFWEKNIIYIFKHKIIKNNLFNLEDSNEYIILNKHTRDIIFRESIKYHMYLKINRKIYMNYFYNTICFCHLFKDPEKIKIIFSNIETSIKLSHLYNLLNINHYLKSSYKILCLSHYLKSKLYIVEKKKYIVIRISSLCFDKYSKNKNWNNILLATLNYMFQTLFINLNNNQLNKKKIIFIKIPIYKKRYYVFLKKYILKLIYLIKNRTRLNIYC